MHLDDECKHVVLDAFDHPELPKRTAAIEMLGKQTAHQSLQRTLVARHRQARVSQVEVHVEALVIDPYWMTQTWHPFDALPVARDRVQRCLRVSADIETTMLQREGLGVE